jgi:hypothetical protein
MGWETRHNGRRYLYRNRRVDGKPLKEYIAANDAIGLGRVSADQLERILQYEAEVRQMTRKAEADYRARIDNVIRLVEIANADLHTFVEGVLYAIGYHNHHRGDWRMNRHYLAELRRRIDDLKEKVEARTKPLIDFQAPANDAEAVDLFKKARAGDEKAMEAVRRLIVARGWVNWLGNISHTATKNLIHNATARDPVWKAGLTEQADNLFTQLIGESPTVLERLLARRVVNGWIATHALELELTMRPPESPRSKEHLDRALSRAEKRMRQAIGELARVRRLKVPAIFNQLNVADKQLVGTRLPAALPR